VRPKGVSVDRAVTVQAHRDPVGRGLQTGMLKTMVLADESA
jgi:hypothetical protein